MTYWAIEVQEGISQLYLPKKELFRPSVRNGVSCLTVRQVFEPYPVQDRIFQVISKGGRSIVKKPAKLSDMLIWSWVSFFTERAKNLMVELGGNNDDFLQCTIESNPDEPCFMHVPRKSYDIIDMTLSTFLMLSDNPPLYGRILTLAFQNLPAVLPSCFMASIPKNNQDLGQWIVDDKFKLAWEERMFTGANFRKLTESEVVF